MAISELSRRAQALRRLGGDEEDSPWMVSTDLHLLVVIDLLQALQRYLATQRGPWYVSGEIFIHYGPAPGDHVAPDAFAAPVHAHPRDVFFVAQEGLFPPLVVEVVSGSSWERDTVEKVELYDLLGAQEYVLFDPTHEGTRRRGPGAEPAPELWGYRRDAQGGWADWTVEADGVLRSAVLAGVGLQVEGSRLRVLTPAGDAVPFTDELEAELQEAAEQLEEAAEQLEEAAEQRAAAVEAASRAAEQLEEAAEQRAAAVEAASRAEAARAREEEARRAAEQELARLRAELRRRGLS